jgi:hypothetical protein
MFVERGLEKAQLTGSAGTSSDGPRENGLVCIYLQDMIAARA